MRLAALLLVVAFCSSGCAVLTKRPAHVVAPLGVQVLSAVEAAQDVIIALGRAGTIPPDQERLALTATVKIGYAGRRLATALRTLDSAQSELIKAQATGEVSAVLDVINGLIFDALTPFTDAMVRAQIAVLLREINALIIAISGAIVRVA